MQGTLHKAAGDVALTEVLQDTWPKVDVEPYGTTTSFDANLKLSYFFSKGMLDEAIGDVTPTEVLQGIWPAAKAEP